MIVRSFDKSQESIWNEFILSSKNGTFLFNRDYMDYHSNRFLDFSLLIMDESGRVTALLPANREGCTVYSHAGLTYGGLISNESMTLPKMLQVFAAVLEYLKSNCVSKLHYKTIPTIYHRQPAEEDRYCLHQFNAKLFRRDVLTVVDYREQAPFQKRRLNGVRRAHTAQLTVRETKDFEAFWEILTNNLLNKFGLRPVHSLDEIKLLAQLFPQEIRLFGAYFGNKICAGAVTYLSNTVCHIQYNAADEFGRKNGALDLVFDNVIKRFGSSKRYFDFGVSTDSHGLNVGLVDYKEGFGGRTVVHDLYELLL